MKILIIHASAGAGHQKAAEAVRDEITQSTKHEVVFIDALDYSSHIFKRLYSGTYSFLITKLPKVWGFVFGLVDIPWLQPFVRLVRRIYNGLNTMQLHQLMIDEQFDYIVSTHFMPNEIASSLKRRKKIKSKIITCVTDYDVHRIWLADRIDKYCVACDWTKNKLLNLGVADDKIQVTGIPSHSKFSAKKNVEELKRQMGIKLDEFTILVATGSFGIGPIEEIIDVLDSFQIIVVCGHNKSLYARLTEIRRSNVHVMGLVDNMHELMAVSNVMVSKPGGLSITEALVSHVPLIFFNAIPGQETNNIKVLREYGIGISHCSISQIAVKLQELRSSENLYQQLREKTKKLARPSAVSDITQLIV